MEASLYKTLTVSRGFDYHYFYSPAQDGKHTLVFLHGYPSTSYDWHHQAAFFRSRGFGVLVPDMLGYGGTAKPLDVQAYRLSLMSRDIVDLLEAENLHGTIVVGHDWGSAVVSRLANYYSKSFAGFAFVSFGYFPPSPEFDILQALETSKKVFGYELFGYWPFMARDDAYEIIEAHWDSAFSLSFPNDPELWKTEVCAVGASENWMLADRLVALPDYLSQKEAKILSDNQRRHGMRAPLLWYKAAVTLLADDDKAIEPAAYTVQCPVFFGLAKKDYICLPEVQMAAGEAHCPRLTAKTYDGDHWLQFSHAEELNADLLQWVENTIAIAPQM